MATGDLLSLAELRRFYPRRRFPVRRAIVEALQSSGCQMLSPAELARRVYRETPSGDRISRLMQSIYLMRKELGPDWLVDVQIHRGTSVITLHSSRLIL
jgi:hypothetical protein